MHVDIGLNSAFLTRRYEERESWISIYRELGVDYMSFDSDALDPFFSGDMDYLCDFARGLGKLAKDSGISITDYFTGMASYRFFGMAHSSPVQRQRMIQWFEDSIRLAAAMGAKGMGGRCDAYSVETLKDPQRLAARYRDVIDAYRGRALSASQQGLDAIYFEQMYVPSLIPYTFAQTYDYIKDANIDNPGVPVRPVVDVGHACAHKYGAQPDELRYTKWLEHFGAACDVIHLQQTCETGSHHGPFSAVEEGYVRIDHILDSLRISVKNAGKEAWAEYLPLPGRIVLVLEILPSTGASEEEVLQQIGDSVAYLRRSIPRGGIHI